MTASEKVAYLKGLAEGYGMGTDTKEGKLLSVIVEVLEEVTHDIEDLESNSYELGEAIDQVSDDLADLEDTVYDDYDDDDNDNYYDEDEDNEDSRGCCGGGCCGGNSEPVFYEVTCPACENTITIDEDVLDLGKIECPNCGETLEFDGIETEDENDTDGSDD